MRPLSALVTVACTLGSVAPARAQDNSATVEALFDAAKALEAQGKFAEACPKFLASYNLEHRVGTVLNLADCYEKSHQLASAWARFVEGATLAQRAGQTARADFATQHASLLKPQLSTLTIVVPAGAAPLAVRRGGVAVDPGAYGVAVAVDGGTYAIEASAPGKKPWSSQVVVKPSGDVQTVTIPALEADVSAAVAPLSPAPEPGGLSNRAIAGLATAGVGVVAIAVGAVFGVETIAKNHDSAPFCNVGGKADNCTSQGVSLRSTAYTDGTLSTVFIGVGAAAVVGGAVLWLTAPSKHPSSTTVGFDGHELVLSGTF